MPKLNPTKKKELLSKVNSFIREGESHCGPIHARVRENGQFERGHQWRKGDTERQVRRERPAIPQNSILKIINAIANREMINRFEPRTYGRSEADAGVAQSLDAATQWQRDQAETQHEESMAFRSAVANGYGIMHKWFDGGAWDGEGKIMDEDVPVWNMLWPLRSEKMNLVDRLWHVYGKVISVSEARYQYGDLPDAKKWFKSNIDDKKSYKGTIPEFDGPASRSFSSLTWADIREGNWYNLAEDELFVVEAEWLDSKRIWRAAIPDMFDDAYDLYIGNTTSMTIENPDPEAVDEEGNPQPMDITRQQLFEDVNGITLLDQILEPASLQIFDNQKEFSDFAKRYLDMTGNDYEDWHARDTRVVMYALVLDDVVIDTGERPYGFTYEFITGWRLNSPNECEFYGVVDVAKGPQDFKNAILSSMLTVYMTSPKNTLILGESVVNNTEEFEDQLSRPVGVVFVKDEFFTEQPPKFLKLDPPSFPQMQSELVALANESVSELFGLSSIDQGTQQDLRRVSGNVVQSAQMAGNTIVAMFFDSLARYRKRFGLLNIKFITTHYTPDQLMRIIGDEFAPDLEGIDPDWGNVTRFDITVEESPTSASEQMEVLSKLQQVGSLDNLLNRGDIDFEDYLEFIPGFPENVKRKLIEKHQYREKMQKEVEDAQLETQRLQAEYELFQQYMAQQGMDQQIQQFQGLLGIAQPMAQQLANAEEAGQETEGAPPVA